MKSLEQFGRFIGGGGKTEIQFGHFRPGPYAGVGQIKADLHLAGRTHRTDGEVAVTEGGIG